MNLNELALDHFESGERMSRHNKGVLASLALIAAEIGQACDDTFEGQRSPRFGEELADVMLRIMELATDEGLDLDEAVDQAEVRWRNPTLHGCFADINVELATCVKAARKDPLDDQFTKALGRLTRRIIGLAVLERLNLTYEILKRQKVISAGRSTRSQRH